MGKSPDAPLRNDDVDWDQWPVVDYLAEFYRDLHPIDAAVIDHHSAFYRQIPAGGIARAWELGAGPNLYPLMLGTAATHHIDAVEYSQANVAYLRQQLCDGPDDSWQPFYARCRQQNLALPATLTEALTRVRVIHGNALATPSGIYELASMHFVAESATEDADEFTGFCHTFIHSVRPGGYLVATFIERILRYRMRSGPEWPGYPVDTDIIYNTFAADTDQLAITRLDADETTAEYGATGMVLLTARRNNA